MEHKPLVYIDGEIGNLPEGDTVATPAIFSKRIIDEDTTLIIRSGHQMLMKGNLKIIGNLKIENEGEVWQL